MNFRVERDSYAWSIRQRKQALKINTPSSETSHNPTRQEDTRSRRHYLPLFQQRDESVYYTLQSIHVSDRLHLLSYCNSINRISRTLIHVVLSPPFHTKRKKLCWRKKVPPCFSLHHLNKKTSQRQWLHRMLFRTLFFFFLILFKPFAAAVLGIFPPDLDPL